MEEMIYLHLLRKQELQVREDLYAEDADDGIRNSIF